METTIIATLVMLGFGCMFIGLLVATAIVIYKDAKAHGMNGALWAALAVFTPNFIGLIIYLVLRSGKEKEYHCSNCQVVVREDYNICPNCHEVFEQMCTNCNRGIKRGLNFCPYCGEEVSEESVKPTATKVSRRTNIVKPLLIIGGLYILLFFLFIGSMFTVSVSSASGYMENVSVMEVTSSDGKEQMSARFQYKSGTEDFSMYLENEEVQEVALNLAIEEGQIIARMITPDGTVAEERVYEVGNYNDILTINAIQSGSYKVELEMKKAKGYYEVIRLRG